MSMMDIDDHDPEHNPHPQMRDLAARLSQAEGIEVRAATIGGRHVLVMPDDLDLEPWASMADDELAAECERRDHDTPRFGPWELRGAALEAGVLAGHDLWSDYGLALAGLRGRRGKRRG